MTTAGDGIERGGFKRYFNIVFYGGRSVPSHFWVDYHLGGPRRGGLRGSDCTLYNWTCNFPLKISIQLYKPIQQYPDMGSLELIVQPFSFIYILHEFNEAINSL